MAYLERTKKKCLMYGKEAKQPKTRDKNPPATHYSEPKKPKTKRQALWKNLNFWIFPNNAD